MARTTWKVNLCELARKYFLYSSRSSRYFCLASKQLQRRCGNLRGTSGAVCTVRGIPALLPAITRKYPPPVDAIRRQFLPTSSRLVFLNNPLASVRYELIRRCNGKQREGKSEAAVISFFPGKVHAPRILPSHLSPSLFIFKIENVDVTSEKLISQFVARNM